MTMHLEEILTPTELQVLKLVSKGYTNSQICEAFERSEPTIKRHLSAIYTKLGLTSQQYNLRVSASRFYITQYGLFGL